MNFVRSTWKSTTYLKNTTKAKIPEINLYRDQTKDWSCCLSNITAINNIQQIKGVVITWEKHRQHEITTPGAQNADYEPELSQGHRLKCEKHKG